MIRKMQKTDIFACAEILCAVYNNEMWQCLWTMETGVAYLEDYFEAKKFIGFVIEENEKNYRCFICTRKNLVEQQ